MAKDILSEIAAAEKAKNYERLSSIGWEISRNVKEQPHLAELLARVSTALAGKKGRLDTAITFSGYAAEADPKFKSLLKQQKRQLREQQDQDIRDWDAELDKKKKPETRLYDIERSLMVTCEETSAWVPEKKWMERISERWKIEARALPEEKAIEHAIDMMGEDEWGNKEGPPVLYPAAVEVVLDIVSRHNLKLKAALDALWHIEHRIKEGNPLAAAYAEQWTYYVNQLPEPAERVKHAMDALSFHSIQSNAANAAARKVIAENILQLPIKDRVEIELKDGVEVSPIPYAIDSAEKAMEQIRSDVSFELFKAGKKDDFDSPEVEKGTEARVAAEMPEIEQLVQAWLQTAETADDETKKSLFHVTDRYFGLLGLVPRLRDYVAQHEPNSHCAFMAQARAMRPMPGKKAVSKFLKEAKP